jgi:hypothetical protein
MAIIYSYPQATPTISDTILGTQFDYDGNPTKSFLISDIISLAQASNAPTLEQVTASGNNTTNPIYIDRNVSELALVINGDNTPNGLLQIYSGDGACIGAYANDGNTILTNSVDGTAIRATSVEGSGVVGISSEGAGITASSTGTGGVALLVGGVARGITVNNGGIKIQGVVHDDTTYQLSLSANSAAKPSTNTWTITSDKRIKTNINPYTKGLETILAINPVTYDYNGKAGFDPTNKDNIAIIAQDVLSIIPESIKTYNALLNEDDEEKTELYNFDSHALTFILINAIKELKAEIDLLKSK